MSAQQEAGTRRALSLQVASLGLLSAGMMAALVVMTLVLGSALPGSPQIAFLSSRDEGGSDLHLIDVERSIDHRLPLHLLDTLRFAWSPDGQRVAFIAHEFSPTSTDIYIVELFTNQLQKVTDYGASYITVAWSPDGRQLAFEADRDGGFEIYVADCAERCDIHRVTTNIFRDYGPVWSPDGRQLIFVSYLDTGRSEIHSMSANGSGVHNLTYRTGPSNIPQWSPDGDMISFTSWHEGRYEIYLMNADCIPYSDRPDNSIPLACENTLRNVSNHQADDWSPVWSPNSQEIVFLSVRDGNTDIYRLNIESGALHRLTNHPAEDRDPAWSPDGQWIVFVSNRDGDYDLYVMDVNGGQVRQLTDTGGNFLPAWRP